MVELKEESDDQTIESLKKENKLAPPPNKPGLITLLEVQKEVIEGHKTYKEKKGKLLYSTKPMRTSTGKGSEGQAYCEAEQTDEAGTQVPEEGEE